MRYYFVSYREQSGGRVTAGDALVATSAEKGVLNILRNNLSEDGSGKDMVILNLKELSEEEYLRLKD